MLTIPPEATTGGPACQTETVVKPGWFAFGTTVRDPTDHPVLANRRLPPSPPGVSSKPKEERRSRNTAARWPSTSLALSWAAGLKTGGRVKYSTYESGMPLLDRSRKRLSIAFFLIAIDFVVFDVEAAFLYPWTVVVRDGGWPLFWAVGVFLLLIVAGYAYVWRKGGLELATRRTRPATGGTR